MLVEFLSNIDWISFLYGYLVTSLITVMYCGSVNTFKDFLICLINIPVFPIYLLLLVLLRR